MKEEWRVHSTMFGSISFALFPIMIFAIAFMGSFLLPLFKSVLPVQDILIITHGNFLLLGLMIGAFGLLGNEVMNRRFGQASLLAYSSRSLPLSERFIFANFVVKDTVYYFIFWVFPFIAGFALATPFTHISPIYPLILSVTLTSSFLFGLSGVFFLSTIYVRSKRVLGIVLVLILVIFVFAYKFAGISVTSLFPPLILFYSFSATNLIITCAVIIIPFIISIALFIPEFTDTTKRYRNMLTPMTRKLWFFPYPPFSAKDLIDMHRSGSIVGQTIFSFIIPLALIWFFLSALTGFLPAYGIFLQFTVLTGVIASTMFTWLTQFDSFTSYACLPVSVKTVIASKINSFTVLQLIPIVFISFVSFTTHNIPYLLPALRTLHFDLILCSFSDSLHDGTLSECTSLRCKSPFRIFNHCRISRSCLRCYIIHKSKLCTWFGPPFSAYVVSHKTRVYEMGCSRPADILKIYMFFSINHKPVDFPFLNSLIPVSIKIIKYPAQKRKKSIPP